MKFLYLVCLLAFGCVSCIDVQTPSGLRVRQFGGKVAYQKGDESLVTDADETAQKALEVAGKFLDSLVAGYVAKSIASLTATTQQMADAGLNRVDIQRLHNEAAKTAGAQAIELEALKLGAGQ